MSGLHWFGLDPRFTPDHLGYLPMFISAGDPRSAKEQLDANYRHGGGWQPFEEFRFEQQTMTLNFPGDPPMKPLAVAQLRDEQIYIFPHSWIMILQKDGSYEVARMD